MRARFVVMWLAIAAFACSPALQTDSVEGAQSRSDWINHSDPSNGVNVVYPPTWVRAMQRLTPNLLSPVEILSLGTFPLRPGGPNCAQVPVNALIDLGPTDAFLTLQSTSFGLGPRPAFGPGVGIGKGQLEDMDCLPAEERDDIGTMQWVPFDDASRGFYLLAVAGRDASSETIADLWSVANSLCFTTAG